MFSAIPGLGISRANDAGDVAYFGRDWHGAKFRAELTSAEVELITDIAGDSVLE
jgi:hypothetical protein